MNYTHTLNELAYLASTLSLGVASALDPAMRSAKLLALAQVVSEMNVIVLAMNTRDLEEANGDC